jgi:hypothetical protein
LAFADSLQAKRGPTHIESLLPKKGRTLRAKRNESRAAEHVRS